MSEDYFIYMDHLRQSIELLATNRFYQNLERFTKEEIESHWRSFQQAVERFVQTHPEYQTLKRWTEEEFLVHYEGNLRDSDYAHGSWTQYLQGDFSGLVLSWASPRAHQLKILKFVDQIVEASRKLHPGSFIILKDRVVDEDGVGEIGKFLRQRNPNLTIEMTDLGEGYGKLPLVRVGRLPLII